MRMKPLLCALMLCAALLAPRALAQPGALDGYMAQLAILSQRDERLLDVDYAGGTLKERGCGPMSVTNAVIGCLGVQDEALAIGMAREMTKLLVPRNRRGNGYLHISLLEDALSREARLAQAEAFPAMAAAMAGCSSAVRFSEGEIDRERLLAAARAGRSTIFVGRAVINGGDWSSILSLVRALHEAGRDDVMLYLAQCDAGKKTHNTPLRSGDTGHYLSLCVPVGALWNDGSLYVLDSLPRALQGEEVDSASVYHVRYSFVEQSTINDIRFRSVFCASRVSPTVIRLSLTQQEREALAKAHAAGADEVQALLERQMTPLVLFGGCTLLVNTAGIPQ